METCAKINGMASIPTIIKYDIITHELDITFQVSTIEECNQHYLPNQFDKEFYYTIQAFHTKRMIDTFKDVKDVKDGQFMGNVVCM